MNFTKSVTTEEGDSIKIISLTYFGTIYNSNTDSTKNTTQKTKEVSNTDSTENTTQKTKEMSNTDHTNNQGVSRRPRRATSSWLL